MSETHSRTSDFKRVNLERTRRGEWDTRRGPQADPLKCRAGLRHRWQPVSLYLNPDTAAPDFYAGRVYCVCMGCSAWTYRVVEFAGYMLGDPTNFKPTPVEDPFEEEEEKVEWSSR
jgi:hypothetical protein